MHKRSVYASQMSIGEESLPGQRNAKQRMQAVPRMFCWTKMGSEAGQSLEAILRRKELERECGHGLFAWGIGSSVAPALNYVRQSLCRTSMDAFFTPMKSRPKAMDVTPSGMVMWRAFCGDDGSVSELPWHILVTSRRHAASGQEKRYHFALMCKRDRPLLQHQGHIRIDAARVRNLLSNEKVGSSQVTAIVKYVSGPTDSARAYPVLFRAELASQPFIRLVDPVPIEGRLIDLYKSACESENAEDWSRRVNSLRREAARRVKPPSFRQATLF